VIIDLNAFTGHWPAHPIAGDLPAVRASLRACDVERICVAPLDAAWCRNPHRCNADLFRAAAPFDDVWPVPVLDPTVATWREVLAAVARQPRVRMVKLLPAYSPYRLSQADELLQAVAAARLAVSIQTRLEDPRRHHPLAQVPDVSAAEIAEAAARHSELKVVIGGARTGEILAQRERLRALPHLYADISQADGFDAVKSLVEAGLTEKLLFGTHAPLFVPLAALARVVTDLSDDAAVAILGGNAERLLASDQTV
jgi:predicted TIM-barrel fold metal-dependent hydrolase